MNGRRALVVGVVSVVGLALQVSAGATPGAGKNLIVNGNAEQGQGVNDVNGVAAEIPGWTRKGKFTVVKYGAPGGFPEAKVSTTVAGGKNFFAGGPANPGSAISQDNNVTSKKGLIDAGKLKATLSGYIGGYASQSDSLIATATYLSAAGTKLGALKIGPVSASARANTTGMIKKTATGAVPKKTRTIRVTLGANRNDGSYNDGYADNLSLTLATGG